jgi:hypothetical protein
VKKGTLKTSACTMLALLVLCALGCWGPGKGDLRGSVKYKGKTVKIGTVSVFGSDGVPKSAVIDRDSGQFHVKDFVTGEVKVTVASPNPKEDIVLGRSPDPKKVVAAESANAQALSLWFQIPARYSDVAKTDLVFTLPRGATQKDLELKD